MPDDKINRQQLLDHLGPIPADRNSIFKPVRHMLPKCDEGTKAIAIRIAQHLQSTRTKFSEIIAGEEKRTIRVAIEEVSKCTIQGIRLFSLSLAAAADVLPQATTLYAGFLSPSYEKHYIPGQGYLLKQLLRFLVDEISVMKYPEHSLQDDFKSVKETFLYAIEQLIEDGWPGYLIIVLQGLETYREGNPDEAKFLSQLEQEIYRDDPDLRLRLKIIYVDCIPNGASISAETTAHIKVPSLDKLSNSSSFELQELTSELVKCLPVRKEIEEMDINEDTLSKCLGVEQHAKDNEPGCTGEKIDEGVRIQLRRNPEVEIFLKANHDEKAIIYGEDERPEREQDQALRTFVTNFEKYYEKMLAETKTQVIHAICPMRYHGPHFLLRSLIDGIVKTNGDRIYPMWMVRQSFQDLWNALHYLIKDAIDRESEANLIFMIHGLSEFTEDDGEEMQKLLELPFLLSNDKKIQGASKERKFTIKAIFTSPQGKLAKDLSTNATIIGLVRQ